MFENAKVMLEAIEKIEKLQEMNDKNLDRMTNIFKQADQVNTIATTLMGWSRDFVADLNWAKDKGYDNNRMMDDVVWPMIEELKERMDGI